MAQKPRIFIEEFPNTIHSNAFFSTKNHLATTKQGQILIKLGNPRIRANLEHVKD
jgi:hypothetical protein